MKTAVASSLVLQLYPPQCVGNLSSRIFLTAMLPLIVVAIVIPVFTLAGKLLGSMRAGAGLGGSFGLVVLWVFTPSVSKMLFQVFDCETFGYADGGIETINSTTK